MEVRPSEIVSHSMNSDIHNRFVYHAPSPDQIPKYEAIRKAALDYAEALLVLCPDSRERSLALTHLDQVVFFANASIARKQT